MGWGDCGTDSKGRPIGYVHEATCDHPGCEEQIDRGLAHACGGMHGTSEGDCEGYFCGKHLYSVEDPEQRLHSAQLCEACKNTWNEYLVEDLLEQVKELKEALPVPAQPTDAQLDRIRETIRGTIEEWRASYRIEPDKTHGDLEALLVGAVMAMHQNRMITINQEAESPGREVK